MQVLCRAKALCEEFSDFVLCDNVRHSIIINTDKEYLPILVKELKRLSFRLIFVTKFTHNDTITCAFIISYSE
jgi:hypothetical protein